MTKAFHLYFYEPKWSNPTKATLMIMVASSVDDSKIIYPKSLFTRMGPGDFNRASCFERLLCSEGGSCREDIFFEWNCALPLFLNGGVQYLHLLTVSAVDAKPVSDT
jgi:hypothetical protein